MLAVTTPSGTAYLHEAGSSPESAGARLPAITAENLEATLLAETRPVAVLCGAAWAAPYRRQLAELESVREAGGSRFGFYTLDALREEELAAWVQVRVLPTTLIFRKGRVVGRFTGLTSRAAIQSALTASAFPLC